MRCLTLAGVLRQSGAEVQFVCRKHSGNLIDLVHQNEFVVHALSVPGDIKSSDFSENNSGNEYESWLGTSQDQDAQETIAVVQKNKQYWLIVDHYALDQKWETKMRPHVRKIMVIDDMANRQHDCDILLDQTYGRKITDYQPLISEDCKLILGSGNALLRPDFSKLRSSALQRREKLKSIKRLMISMGSMDEANITPKIIEALTCIDWETKPTIDVVLTSGAPHIATVKEIAANSKLTVNVIVDASNMAELMLEADLAIGAGGTTSWERCCLALPTILIILSENQKIIGKNLANIGATITLQKDSKMEERIKQSIEMLMQNKNNYMAMCHNSAKLCDGNGAKRTVDQMMKVKVGDSNDI